MLLHRRPDGDLGRVGHQELDDGALLARFLDLEQVHARDPAVGDGLVKNASFVWLTNEAFFLAKTRKK